jgi:FkbM family methyltransferase
MSAVKKTAGMLKEFSIDGETYSFYYMPDPTDPNNASVYTFTVEEGVRNQFWYPYVHKDDIVFDIGASFGSYTLSALALGATVYSFSPEHEFPKIKKSVYENRGFRQRCYIFNFGFHSKNGLFNTDTMAFRGINDISEEEIRAVNDHKICGWYIPVKTLDEFVPTLKLDKINMIKIDTEGAEYDILQGGINTLKKYRPKILVEFHLFKDPNIAGKCHELLRGIGYEGQAHPYSSNNISHGFYIYST